MSDRDDLARVIAEELRKDREGFGSCDFPADLADTILAKFEVIPRTTLDTADHPTEPSDDHRQYTALSCHFCDSLPIWEVIEKESGESLEVCERHTWTAFS